MQERAANIGATFELASVPGHGTEVRVSVILSGDSIDASLDT
jgi:signal transduction histidine kinase